MPVKSASAPKTGAKLTLQVIQQLMHEICGLSPWVPRDCAVGPKLRLKR